MSVNLVANFEDFAKSVAVGNFGNIELQRCQHAIARLFCRQTKGFTQLKISNPLSLMHPVALANTSTHDSDSREVFLSDIKLNVDYFNLLMKIAKYYLKGDELDNDDIQRIVFLSRKFSQGTHQFFMKLANSALNYIKGKQPSDDFLSAFPKKQNSASKKQNDMLERQNKVWKEYAQILCKAASHFDEDLLVYESSFLLQKDSGALVRYGIFTKQDEDPFDLSFSPKDLSQKTVSTLDVPESVTLAEDKRLVKIISNMHCPIEVVVIEKQSLQMSQYLKSIGCITTLSHTRYNAIINMMNDLCVGVAKENLDRKLKKNMQLYKNKGIEHMDNVDDLEGFVSKAWLDYYRGTGDKPADDVPKFIERVDRENTEVALDDGSRTNIKDNILFLNKYKKPLKAPIETFQSLVYQLSDQNTTEDVMLNVRPMFQVRLSDLTKDNINKSALTKYVKGLSFTRYMRWCRDNNKPTKFYASVLVEIFDKEMASVSTVRGSAVIENLIGELQEKHKIDDRISAKMCEVQFLPNLIRDLERQRVQGTLKKTKTKYIVFKFSFMNKPFK